jgi:WD40 repeat protein
MLSMVNRARLNEAEARIRQRACGMRSCVFYVGVQAMKRVWLAAIAATVLCWQMCPQMAAGELQRDVLSIAYAKGKNLVAAAYRGGQVVVWDFESGRVKNVYNASAPKVTLSQPLAHFSAGGRRLAFTQEGDAGLISYDLETGAATVLVPHRLLVKGIGAFSWSQLADSVLVAIGRDVLLINGQGHMLWQHRLETRALITDAAWHPTEQYYTVATDDGEVSTWEASSGRVIASAKLPTGAQSAAVKVGWTSEDSLAATERGVSLAVLDPETLKPKKTTACNCRDFTWSAGGKELFAWAPPNIAVFSESGQRTREVRTPFDGEGTIEWAGEGRVLTAFSDSEVVLRDVRTGRILRTFGLQ